MTRLPLAVVVACNQDWIIGAKGGMPWHIPEDLRHFKRVTMDHAILMGRKTYESIGRPLPKRRNIVITRNPEWEAEGCEVAHSLEQAIGMARDTDPCPVVIGGGTIYELALPLVTRMWITEVHRDIQGDTCFPAFEPNAFEEISRRAAQEHDDVFFVEYRRKTSDT